MTATILAIAASVLSIVEHFVNKPRVPRKTYQQRRDEIYR